MEATRLSFKKWIVILLKGGEGKKNNKNLTSLLLFFYQKRGDDDENHWVSGYLATVDSKHSLILHFVIETINNVN